MYIEQLEHIRGDLVTPTVLFYSKNVLDNVTLKERKFNVNKKYCYLDYDCGFDTEFYTKAIYNEKQKMLSANAYLYTWQFSIDNYVIIGRKIQEFINLLEMLYYKLQIDDTRKIRIWVANLGCEFQFIRKHINIVDLFAKTSREPIYFETGFNGTGGIVFQDCLPFTGSSLKSLAKDYTTTQKAVGDLEYDIPRNSLTPLNQKELGYIINDVVILSEYNNYVRKTFHDNGFDIPCTKTGLIRKAVKERFKEFTKDYKNRKWFNKQTLGQEQYNNLMYRCYRGGYVHSNLINTGYVHNHVWGIDYTSSYPAVMLQCHFPTGEFRRATSTNLNDFKNYAWFAKFKFKTVKPTTFHSIESICKTLEYEQNNKNEQKTVEQCGIVLDNGRIQSADYFTVYLTDVDYRNYEKFYTWEDVEIEDLWYTTYGELPRYLLDVLEYFYFKKCELKKEGKSKTTDYVIAKAMVNSAYGMCVQKLMLSEIRYADDTWCTIKEGAFEDEIKKICLQPQWGVWISAHARNRLLSMVYNINEDVIYCDTDSIYMKNYEKHKDVIDRYNNMVLDFNKKYLKEFCDDIGCFDLVNEHGEYINFKTLGAKRYVKQDKEEIEVTIAGLPKGTLQNYCEENNLDIFSYFEDKMKMDIYFADKNAHKYNDKRHEDDITDIYGNTEHMISESSLGIYKTSFTMTLSDYYKQCVDNVKGAIDNECELY